MSPRKRSRSSSDAISGAVARLWGSFGLQIRDARRQRGWSVSELARRAELSPAFVYMMEAGESGSADAATRIAKALGRRAEMVLIDPRRPATERGLLSVDLVHSAMGEFEAARLRSVGARVGLDEPYQHYHFAGRADVLAWNTEARALLHIENRSRFPDFQDMAGSYNAKRAYLGRVIAERLDITAWKSETHVIAALWSSEVLHAVRLRTESFRALCPDPTDSLDRWWDGTFPLSGVKSIMVVLDPLSSGRQRPYIGLDRALTARPRHRDYVDAVATLRRAA